MDIFKPLGYLMNEIQMWTWCIWSYFYIEHDKLLLVFLPHPDMKQLLELVGLKFAVGNEIAFTLMLSRNNGSDNTKSARSFENPVGGWL